MAPRVAPVVAAAVTVAMAETAALVVVAARGSKGFFPYMVETAALGEAAEPRRIAVSFCVRYIPGKGAPSAAVPTVTTGAAAGHWAGPYSASLAAFRYATVPSTTIM